jgi:integrase
MTEHLTTNFIRGLVAPSAGNKITYDTTQKGLGVRITARGARAFVFNYTVGARERRITIGPFPEWTVVAAREHAKTLRREVDKGNDPLEIKQESRAAPTVNDLWKMYEAEYLPRHGKAGQRDITGQWNKIILPRLGAKKLRDLRTDDLDKLHRDISQDRPIKANRMIEVFRSMLNRAMRKGWIEKNVAQGFQRNPEVPRHRYLSAAELLRLGDALDTLQSQQAADAIRLLCLTGARLREVLRAQWDHFDFENNVWSKPAHSTKQRKLHSIPISPAAAAIFLAQPRTKSPYVFPAKSGKPMHSIFGSWRKAVTRAKIENARIHDLRHTFASQAISAGHTLPVIGALLGHTQAQTTLRYAHLADDPLRKATNQVATILSLNGR